MSMNRKEEIVLVTLELAAEKRACKCVYEHDCRYSRNQEAFAI